MARKNPLEIPEILAQIGNHISMWNPKFGRFSFYPKDMLSCLLVSHHFRNTLLPIFWYTFDEELMSAVPINIIRKYTPYFRIHHNYGFRKNYPTNNREPCTLLTHLTMSWFYDQWEIHDFEFLNKNSGLKFLRGTDWFRFSGVLYNDAFSNLKQLENLRYMTNGDGGSHQQLFQPISATLKSLHLMCHRGSLDLHGLVFPNMTELEIDLSDPHDTMNILQACPQLESLGLPSSGTERAVNHLIQALNSGTLCPTLKILKLKVKSLQTEDFARMIESRSGLETLHLELQSAGVRVAIAINHQASSLTHLRIRRTGNDSIMPFMLAVVGSCGQLKDVMVDEVRAEAIDGLMSKDSWMNPDGLENLTLSGTPLSLCGEELTKLVEKPASDPLRLPIDGWKISSQAKKVIRDKSYLTTLFQFAQGFGRLRAITINDVVYHKVSAQ